MNHTSPVANKALHTGVTLAVLAAIGTSFKAILVKSAYSWPIESITLLALRLLIAAPLFIFVALRKNKCSLPLNRRDWIAIIALGLAGNYATSILDFIGLRYISAAQERLILFTYPTLTVLIGVIFFGRRWGRGEGIALVLCYSGIALGLVHDLRVSTDTKSVLIGSAFVFSSALCYAFHLAGSGSVINRLGAARFAALTNLVSTAATVIHFLLTQSPVALVQPWEIYALASAMAIFSTVLPVFMLAAAIHRIGSAKSALIGMLGPILTIFFSWWLLAEPISALQMAGASLVIFGVCLVGRQVRSKQGH